MHREAVNLSRSVRSKQPEHSLTVIAQPTWQTSWQPPCALFTSSTVLSKPTRSSRLRACGPAANRSSTAAAHQSECQGGRSFFGPACCCRRRARGTSCSTTAVQRHPTDPFRAGGRGAHSRCVPSSHMTQWSVWCFRRNTADRGARNCPLGHRANSATKAFVSIADAG